MPKLFPYDFCKVREKQPVLMAKNNKIWSQCAVKIR